MRRSAVFSHLSADYHQNGPWLDLLVELFEFRRRRAIYDLLYFSEKLKLEIDGNNQPEHQRQGASGGCRSCYPDIVGAPRPLATGGNQVRMRYGPMRSVYRHHGWQRDALVHAAGIRGRGKEDYDHRGPFSGRRSSGAKGLVGA